MLLRVYVYTALYLCSCVWWKEENVVQDPGRPGQGKGTTEDALLFNCFHPAEAEVEDFIWCLLSTARRRRRKIKISAPSSNNNRDSTQIL